ncbi:MAG: helix-turn-helix transcriptional regulator [Clostridiales bacterium]|nr:helix-turn-helix transcriptional regulator [Clostridiales bacterium]
MDTKKFACFVAERRKELNMTQKELAAKIHVTDKAVSRWERGLGFPDINTIEDLANALNVSIVELMKSERPTENVSVNEVSVVSDIMQIAKADSEERHKIISYTFAITTILLTILDILLSIDWNAQDLSLSARVPFFAIIPGVIMILYAFICKIRGKKTYGIGAIGISLLLIPIIVIGVAFLVCALITG